MKKLMIAAVALLVVLTAFKQDKVTTIFIIGDSTAAKKDLSKGSPERGWGMLLQEYFDADYVVVDNHAVNGRSSKSFIDEGQATTSSFSSDITTRRHSRSGTPTQAQPSTITWRNTFVRRVNTAAFRW